MQKPVAQAAAVLSLQDVWKIYPGQTPQTAAVRGVSLDIAEGSWVSLMGTSGGGKSTLLNLIASLDHPDRGTLRFKDNEITTLDEAQAAAFRRDHLGFIFQDYNLLDTLTLKENILLALKIRRQRDSGELVPLARKLGIEELLDRYPAEVSGGQQQRCACVRALICHPDLILADEPTGALDSDSAGQLLQILDDLRTETGSTLFMVTHDPAAAARSQQVLLMKDGQLHHQLTRTSQTEAEFLDQILESQRRLALEPACVD